MRRILFYRASLILALFGFTINTYAQCGPGQSELTLTIDFSGDSYPEEDGWRLINLTDGITVDSACFATYVGQSGIVNITICADTNKMYTLHAYDDFGDGLDGSSYSIGYANAGNISTIGTNNFNIASSLCNPSYSNNELADSTTAFMVQYVAAPACLDPTALSASNITTISADLSWTEQNAATSWQLEITTAGSGLGTGTRGVVATNPYTVTGLPAATALEYYVRSICSSSDSSSWAGPFNFTTPCNTVTSFPYSEDFDGSLTNSVWDCWSVIDADGVGGTWEQEDTYITPRSGSWTAHGMGNNDDHLITPQLALPAGTNMRMKVWDIVESATYDNTYSVLVSTTGNSIADFQDTLATYNVTNTTWAERTIDLSAYAGQNIYISLWQSYSAATFYGFGLDDFLVEQTPSCVAVTSPLNSAVTATSATVNWTENGSAAEWEMEYGTSGFTLGTGSVVQVLTDTFTTISSLTPSTTYDWYVRAVCGAADSSGWTSVESFSTTALSVSVPYAQDFEGMNPLSDFTLSIGSNATLLLDAGSNCAGTNSLHMAGGSSSGWSGSSSVTGTSATQAWVTNSTKKSSALLSVDATTVTASALELTFDLKQGWSYGPGYSWARVTVNGTQISPDYRPSTQNADACTNRILDLSAYIGTTFNLAFEFSGKYDDARGSGGNGDNGFFDNIEINPKTCPDPSNLTATNITGTSADLGWTENGTATAWTVEYGAQGFTVGTGTPVSATGTTLNVSSLSTFATYDFYVQSNCGADSSRMVGPHSFTTGSTLAGSYTIDSTMATSATNFESFSVFASAINAVGVSGAVDVSVAANTYNDQLSLGEIQGASMTNTVTINGIGATLTHDKSIRNSTITLQGSSWLTIKNMTIAATGGTDSWGIHLFDSAHHITIESNMIQLTVGNTSDVAGIIGSNSETSDASSGNNAFDITIRNNTITGGERGVSLYGSFTASARNSGMTISNNMFTNNDDNGIYLTGYESVAITDNTINTPNNSFSDAMYCSDLENFNISRNYFSGNDLGFDADDLNYDNTVTSNSTISNNMFIGGDDAFYLDDVENINIFHNTTYGEDYGFYLNDDANLDIRNNIFFSNSDYAFYSLDANTTSLVMDYNIFHTNGTGNLVKFGTPTYADLVAFQAAQTALNVNSLEGDPTFFNNGVNLHVSGPLANDVGDNSVGITVDIDGDTRPEAPSTTVDIGADEFTPPFCLLPTALASSNVTATSVLATWTEAGSATQWEVEYGATGYTPGSGTSIIVNVDTFTTITGLTPQTPYDWNVRTICGSGASDTSSWSGPSSFTTLCVTFTAPFNENFDGLALTSPYTDLPACWTPQVGPDFWDVTNDVANNSHTYLPNLGDHTSGTGNYMWIDASGDILGNSMETPLIDISGLTTPYAGFWFASDNTTNAVNHTINLDVWDGSAWLNIATESGNFTGWVEVAGLIPATVPSTTQFRIQAIAATGTTTSTYYYNDLGVDDFFVTEAPTKAPISLPITWDDGATVDLTTPDFGGNASMVLTDPTNASNMVLQGIKTVGAQVWGGTSFGDSLATAIPFDPANTILSAVVWSPDSGVVVKLKAEDKTNPAASVETDVITSKTGWDTLRFDMTFNSGGTPAINYSTVYDKLSIFYNFGVSPTVADTFYVDLVEFTGGTAPPPAKDPIGLPITWEDTATVDYTVVDFGGNASMMTNDPMNSSNLVLQSVKTAGAQVWAGTSFGNSLDTAIAFSTGNTTIRAVVYSPIIGAEVRVKVEDQTNPGISVESADTTTVIGWDTLDFDMSMQVSGTAAINFANTYDKMSIFYNFGVQPTVADTFYVDYVALENPPVISMTDIPYLQDFEGFANGAPTAEGWTNVRTGNPQWLADNGGTPSSATGPTVDHTVGTAAGRYIFLETSSSTAGVADTLVSSVINTGANDTILELSYWYHMHGATMGTLEAWVIDEATGTPTLLNTITGQQQAGQTDAWLEDKVAIAGFENSQIRVAFVGVAGSSYTSDMSIDDVAIGYPPADNIGITSIVGPNSGCGLSSTDSVEVVITNFGSATQTNFNVGYSVNGTAITPEVVSGPLAGGMSMNYTFTTPINLGVAGNYSIDAYSLLTGDSDNSNDSSTATVTSYASVSSFPYAQSFETGSDWSVEGNSTFALGTPAGTLIDTASDGTQAWVTNLTGDYNAGESGYIISPCFDFTNIVNPYIALDLNYEIEGGWDGAVMQTTTDGGASWATVGAFNDPVNWYNDNGVNALTTISNQLGWSSSTSGNWITAEHYLDGLGGQSTVQIRILLASDGGVQEEGIGVDNINIWDRPIPDPYYPIGIINTEDATTGDADSLGVDCWISGITIGYNKRGSGVDFSIVDMSTGSQEGITLFDFNPVSGYVFQEGDSLMVHGAVSQYRGLIQFSPDSISIIASGVSLPTPIIANIFDESTESKLVQTTDDFVIINTPGSGSFNLDLSNGTDTVTIRIDSDSDIDDSLAIATNAWVVGDTLCGMIGVGGQFDFNTPFLDSYQMFPRSWNDITVCRNTIGISDNDKSLSSFSIYPNPSNGMVTIESTGYNSNRVEIEVLDLNGRTVAASLILNGTAPSRELIDLSNVAKGIYFVSIIDGENRLVEKLIIK